jgi:hypothetical protein
MRALDGLPGLISTGDFANFSVRGRGPRDNLIFVDDLPFDRVVHFDQTLGEEEDIGGGGRFSIFAPNSIAGAEFFPRRLERRLRRSLRVAAQARGSRRQPIAEREHAHRHCRRRGRLRGPQRLR